MVTFWFMTHFKAWFSNHDVNDMLSRVDGGTMQAATRRNTAPHSRTPHTTTHHIPTARHNTPHHTAPQDTATHSNTTHNRKLLGTNFLHRRILVGQRWFGIKDILFLKQPLT